MALRPSNETLRKKHLSGRWGNNKQMDYGLWWRTSTSKILYGFLKFPGFSLRASRVFSASFPDFLCGLPGISLRASRNFSANFPDFLCEFPGFSLWASRILSASFPDFLCGLPGISPELDTVKFRGFVIYWYTEFYKGVKIGWDKSGCFWPGLVSCCFAWRCKWLYISCLWGR